MGQAIDPGQLRYLTAKFGDILPQNRKARRQLMAAEILEQGLQFFQGRKQRKIAVASGRSLSGIATEANQKHRATVLLGQPGGHNAHHALMPVFPGQYNGVGVLNPLQHRYSICIDFRFNGLALPVEPA